jgi:hypothetical protein
VCRQAVQLRWISGYAALSGYGSCPLVIPVQTGIQYVGWKKRIVWRLGFHRFRPSPE